MGECLSGKLEGPFCKNTITYSNSDRREYHKVTYMEWTYRRQRIQEDDAPATTQTRAGDHPNTRRRLLPFDLEWKEFVGLQPAPAPPPTRHGRCAAMAARRTRTMPSILDHAGAKAAAAETVLWRGDG
jgi:hypothetical protein